MDWGHRENNPSFKGLCGAKGQLRASKTASE